MVAMTTTRLEHINATMTSSLHSFNESTGSHGNDSTDVYDDSGLAQFMAVVQVIVPVIFGLIAVLGLVGNLLVIVVVVRNRTMRSTTNALIVSLAVADLVFIVVCVPLTALSYSTAPFPFGTAVCRLYQSIIHVTAYASVYTLVLMSFDRYLAVVYLYTCTYLAVTCAYLPVQSDRYLAVVHPIRSMTLRNERNACVLIAVVWTLIAVGQAPSFTHYDIYVLQDEDGTDRSLCINVRHAMDDGHAARVFYGTFFAFGYVLPLALVSLLYGLMIRRLLFGDSGPSASGGGPNRRRRSTAVSTRPRSGSRCPAAGGGLSETARARRRVTKMVVVVVVIFAVCWLPFHVLLVVQSFWPTLDVVNTVPFFGVKIAATCLAYMNSCVNPILYAFLSDNFRKSFRRLVLPIAVFFRLSSSASTSLGPGPSCRMSVGAATGAGFGGAGGLTVVGGGGFGGGRGGGGFGSEAYSMRGNCSGSATAVCQQQRNEIMMAPDAAAAAAASAGCDGDDADVGAFKSKSASASSGCSTSVTCV